MAVWTWAVGPWNYGPNVGSVNEAGGKRYSLRRTDAGDASYSLPGTHRLFGKIVPRITDLWVTRDGSTEFRGRHGVHRGSGNGVATSREFSAGGYKALLAKRETAGKSWPTSTDPTDAAWQLLTMQQARPGRDLGIVRGPRRASGVRAGMAVADGQWMNDALDTIAGYAPGVDWDVVPTSTLELLFEFWPGGRGTDRGLILDVGGRITSFTEQGADTYANAGRVTGKAPGDEDAGVIAATQALETAEANRDSDRDVATAARTAYNADKTNVAKKTAMDEQTAVLAYRNAEVARIKRQLELAQAEPKPVRVAVPDLATRPEGAFDFVEQTEQTKTAGLTAQGQRILADRQQTPIAWTAQLRDGFWQGRQHIDVGDPFLFVNAAPGYAVLERYVVEEITADFSGVLLNEETGELEGEPAVSIGFGTPPPGRFQQRRTDQSLASLTYR